MVAKAAPFSNLGDDSLVDMDSSERRLGPKLRDRSKLKKYSSSYREEEEKVSKPRKTKVTDTTIVETSNVGRETNFAEPAPNRDLDGDVSMVDIDTVSARLTSEPVHLECSSNGSDSLTQIYNRKKGKTPLTTLSKKPTDLSTVAPHKTLSEVPCPSDYARVKNTIRTFYKNFLHFVQEEEKRCAKVAMNERKIKASKSMKTTPEVEIKRSSKRPDLKAVTKMMEANSVLYPQKRFGSIPGVDVGYQFLSRAEMVAVGFHGHWLNGIDCMGKSYKNEEEYKKYSFPLAVSIVMSGQYEDDLDNCDDVVYTGQGGNNLLGDKRQVNNQVMERGNLGLKNAKDQDIPVRVVRGHKSTSSYVGKVYTYDGLYKVVDYWAELGVSGFTVFKFRLRRLDGQPNLTTSQVQFIRGRVPKMLSELRGVVSKDISGGQEKIPIPATNVVDDPPFAPTGFNYCKSVEVPKGMQLPGNATGCDCKGSCLDPRRCACAQLNGSDFPYVHRDGGRLIEAKDVIFECGPNCKCGSDCVNRTSQRVIRYHLEVFRTPRKGWAVRSWDFIPSGAPVCEYTGVLKSTHELNADSDVDNNYIFDIDCLQTMEGLEGRERRFRNVKVATNKDVVKSDSPEFCIDAGFSGGIARFINHSCAPNLFVQCVLSSHHDLKLARVVLFAADNIQPMQELAYDYGYALDSVLGADGKIKQLACYCGAVDCRKRLF